MIDIRQIRERLINEQPFTELREEARITADQYISEGLPQLTYRLFSEFERSGDREQYQRVYFGRRGTLSALVLTSLTLDEPDYWEALEDVIWEICNEYTWCLPAHLPANSGISSTLTVDLFAAETAHTLAEIICLLEGKLSKDIQLRVRMEVEKRVFEPVFASDQLLHWEVAAHNWASVCAGSVGMAAMLLVKDKERLEYIIRRMTAALECFLSGYGEDGGCAEGIGYWEYGFGYFIYFAEMLREHTNGSTDLIDCEKVRAIAAFPEAVYLSEGVFVNYSDSAEIMVIQPGLIRYLRNRFGVCASIISNQFSRIQDDPCCRWAHLIRNVAWGEVQALDRGEPPLQQGLIQLKNLGWDIYRNGEGNQITAFSTKAGHNGEPHNHNDLGHFIIHSGGKNLLCDLGIGFYTRDYFGEGRYSILNNSSSGHSVPIINGVMQAAGKSFYATVLYAHETETGSDIKLDLTQAYPLEDELKSFTRSFRWESGKVLYLEDKFQFTTPKSDSDRSSKSHLNLDSESDSNRNSNPNSKLNSNPNSKLIKLEERFISRISPLTTQGTVVWQEASVCLSLQYDSARFNVEVETVEQLDHYGKLDVVYITKLIDTKYDLESAANFRFDLS